MTESFVGGQQQGSSTSYRGASSSSGIKQQNVNSNNNNTTSHQRDLSPDRIKKTKTTAATSIMTRAFNWSGKDDFLLAQGKIFGILVIAYIGNVWEPSYNRNENHDMFTFWFMNILIGLVGIYTLKHDATASSRGVQLLSRAQTEEWKGWMQWAFIMVRIVYTVQYFLSCKLHALMCMYSVIPTPLLRMFWDCLTHIHPSSYKLLLFYLFFFFSKI